MSAMTTSLAVLSSDGSRTEYAISGVHNVLKPATVIQRVSQPVKGQDNFKLTFDVRLATVDASGLLLPDPNSAVLSFRYDRRGQAADRAASLAYVRDIVNSDEYAQSVETGLRFTDYVAP
jgi:hypothetical protein